MVKVKPKMGPKVEGKVLKKGKRGGKKSKAVKLQVEDEAALNRGNGQSMADEMRAEQEADLSLLSKPVEISVTGVRQLLKIFQNTTVEMRDLLSTECDLVYECKVCRSLYRSVANFVSHKRSYCKEQYSDTRHVFPTSHRVEDELVIIQPEPVPVMPCSETWKTSDSLPASHPGVTSDENSLVTAEIKASVPPISSYVKPKRNLSQVVEDLVNKHPNVNSEPVRTVSAAQFYTSACEKILAQREIRKEQTLHLEPMEGTSCGVFQTVIPPSSSIENTDLMKTQVAELHGMIAANEATLGPFGEITVINGEGETLPVDTSITALKKDGKRKGTPCKTKSDITCNICNLAFETRKTFLHHNNRHHAAYRVHYPCPCCRDTFANAINVYRHLYKVHRKSSAQVRRLRSKVLNRVYMGKVSEHENQDNKKKSKAVEPLSEADKAKQEQERIEKETEDWMQNLEDDLGLQMCGGCGRRFERRAALNSHSQTCAKRIEVRKKTNRFYPISTVGSNSNVQNNNTKVPLSTERAHSSRSETLLKSEITNTETISSRLTPVSIHSEGTMSSGAKSGTSPAHSPLPHETTFSVPVPPVPTTLYLRSPSNSGNPEKKIEIQIRRNYFKTEIGSVNTSAALGSTGSGSAHSLGKSGYHGRFSTVASTSGKSFEATASSFQDTVSEQGKRSTTFEKETIGSGIPLKVGNADDEYEVEDSKAHLSLPLGLGSSRQLSSCVIETSSSQYSKPSVKLNESKEIGKCHLMDEHVEDDEQAGSKMRYWRNFPKQNEYCVENFHLQKVVKDTEQHNVLTSKFIPQKKLIGQVGKNSVKYEAEMGPIESAIFNKEEQITSKIKNRRKGRKGKYDCYINHMINGKKRECVLCHKRYNKVACRRRQVALKVGYYSYQCMLCDSRYLSKALCLTHITDEHNIHKTQALFQQKCNKIMFSHSKALRLRSGRLLRIGRKSSASEANDAGSADAENVNVLAKEAIKTEETEESNAVKQLSLSKEKYTGKIQSSDVKSSKQNFALFRECCGVKRTHCEESKERCREENRAKSVAAQKRGCSNRSSVGENSGKSGASRKEDCYTLLATSDRKEHDQSESKASTNKPKTKSSMHTSSVYSDLIPAEGEDSSKEGVLQHDYMKKVETGTAATKRRLPKAKQTFRGRRGAVNESVDSIPASDETRKLNEQRNIPACQNIPSIITVGRGRKGMNTIDSTISEMSEQKSIIAQNTSVVQCIFKALGGTPLMTETVTKDEVGVICDETHDKHTSHENDNENRSKIRKTIQLDAGRETFHQYSNSSDKVKLSEEAHQPIKQVSCVTNNLSGELMILAPLRRRQRLSGQKPDSNIEPLVDLTKTTNSQDKRHGHRRSSSPNSVILAKRCRTNAQANVVNVESNIACLNPLHDLEDDSNSSSIQYCDAHEGMKQRVNRSCEGDFQQEKLSESCNGSFAKDGNYPLPVDADYIKEERAENNRRTLRQTKSKQLVTIKKYKGTADEKQNFCLNKFQQTVSDFRSNKLKNVEENSMNTEEAGAEEILLQKVKMKSNKIACVRPLRKGKTRLHNPAALLNAETHMNRADSVGTSKMEQQISSKEPGIEASDDLEPSVENPSTGGEASEQQTALRKLVMEVIFGTGQDCDTTQQLLSAALNGTQYDSQYASSPSSSIDTSPSSSVCSPAFSANDTTEEALKTKEESKIMAQKKTVLNSFPEKKQRPVRNRIKLEREDFIYDLPDRCRDTKRENDDRFSVCSSVPRSKQQSELVSSSVASCSDSTSNLQNIPKVVLVRTNNLMQAAKTASDKSSLSTENLVGASESFGAGSVAYKVSKRKSQVQDAKCKLVASNKERTD